MATPKQKFVGMAEPDETPGFADDVDTLDMLFAAKLDNIKAFQDPILQHQYEKLLENEENLLSLDELIAASKVRFSVAVRKGGHMEVAQLLRSVTDAVEKAVAVREKNREYVHLEQVLWLLDKFFEIANDEVSDQDEVRAIAARLQKLVLIPRDEVPLEKRRMARALAEGRRPNSGA